jgi:hypothetical protein
MGSIGVQDQVFAARVTEHSIVWNEHVTSIGGAVKQRAIERGWGMFEAIALATAAIQLARRALLHGGGTVMVEELEAAGRCGMRLHVWDRDQPAPDAAEPRSRGSRLTSLLDSRRLVDSLEVETSPGEGCVVRATKWYPAPPPTSDER